MCCEFEIIAMWRLGVMLIYLWLRYFAVKISFAQPAWSQYDEMNYRTANHFCWTEWHDPFALTDGLSAPHLFNILWIVSRQDGASTTYLWNRERELPLLSYDKVGWCISCWPVFWPMTQQYRLSSEPQLNTWNTWRRAFFSRRVYRWLGY